MAGELYDALVIGAGAGGLCAAPRLAHRGRHTLLIESRDRVGGRASTEEQGGIKVKFRIKRREVALQNTPLGRRRRDPGRGQVLGLQIAKAGDHAMGLPDRVPPETHARAPDGGQAHVPDQQRPTA